MKKTQNIITNLLIAAHALLLLLLVFESSIVIPAWLQVMGRLHPLLLHFPIALAVSVTLFGLYRLVKPTIPSDTFKTYLLLAALLAVLTSLSGLFLSKENGYDADSISNHKWSAVILSWLLFVWSMGYNKIVTHKWISGLLAFGSLATVTLAGHWGANITHGEDFLLAPVLKQDVKPAVLLEDAMVYNDMVKPILEAKCMNCHNEQKAKGELIMTTEALLLKGGKNGKLWNLQTPGFGLMMDRIHLPMQQKKHMPPTGKPQLTQSEILILEKWIATGASFTQTVATLPTTDTLHMMAAGMFGNLENTAYDFDAASTGTIKKLNTSNRSVYPLAIDEPALAVEFFGRSQYQPAQLNELLEVKTQIVSLNLNKMPIKDEELKIIGEFESLRKLNLSFTDITGAGISALKSLKNLQQLSISGTALTAKDFIQLKAFPALTALYAWNTKANGAELKDIQQALSKTNIQWGFNGDTITMKLNAPIIENEAQIITDPIELKLKHFLPGVTMRYTLDGTEPDSTTGTLYKPGMLLQDQALLKAKAFKPGWISSDVSQLFFFKNKHSVDSAVALLPPDNAYKGNGVNTLIDHVKGDNNFRSGKYLGYRNNNLDVLLIFNQPKNISSITLSSVVDVGSYIMPPMSMEVWAGSSKTNLKLLGTLQPAQPSKQVPTYTIGFTCSFAAQPLQYIRVVAKPVKTLPAWHPGKGDKGWYFADEIFVN